MGTPVASIHQIIRAIPTRPCIVAIDGHSGAGKSHLANSICKQLKDAVVVRNDDFYQPMDESVREALTPEQGYQQYFDWRRLEQQVLLPIYFGRSARYQRYDWMEGRLGEATELSPKRIVIVEGIYSTRPELKDYYDLRIWVETCETTRMRRQVARRENSIAWVERWAAAERLYVDRYNPTQWANLIASGESPLNKI